MYQQLLKSFNRLHPRAWDFIQLMRLDRPIGIYLLLWPTLCALWIAGDGTPSAKNIIIFTLGVILMRSAGCAINDYADRNIDGDVARTKDRPIITGRVTPKEALITFAVLVGLSFILVLMLNIQTLYWAFIAVGLAALYPFTKRYTHFPQIALGAAYSCGILLAFSAEKGYVPTAVWLLYFANLLWTVAYDTYYAMSDREDDLKIGVKSTAVLFADMDRYIILALQACSLIFLARASESFGLSGFYHVGLLAAAFCFVWEFIHTRKRDAESSLQAFLHNHWAGFVIFLGLIAST
ncbi:4-hydroxybenzoate octaprenyltransferase [Denitrificimonas sp. JX-1]|uniref:4-hydroxybenzoate octaprenyltransferase n=1 Tax=Denitrificimonas halotolerans TaxID=3098930 RepID=A0ABU5GT95_9GAMM|nr:4-hydroxybenzoate octaprenyltransferase [Denitrificimonas sp. JX-1]MDY7220221.1 4-hydroxybenzoate octaprenyltransferase [Denitrificimonas sp. JX-1]